jgi:hypothetical protein
MKKTKKSNSKKHKINASGRKAVAGKSKLSAKKAPVKVKASTKKSAGRSTAASKVRSSAKTSTKKRARVSPIAPSIAEGATQSVETVQLKPRARVARAGAGGGDFGGISVVEDVDSESADELLEEGQTFEAGIVRGVEEADTNIEQEVHTHEVTQDDVPGEYDDKDRP